MSPTAARGNKLAGDHADGPALPRGRSSLAPAEAGAIQRRRLVRAAIAAVADRGYAQTTVREIARRARVSLRTFYEQFGDLEDCVLTAVDEADAEIAARVATALRDLPEDATPIDRLRTAFEANLAAWAEEPELSAVLHLELRAAGPAGRERYFNVLNRFARFCRAWHREADPDGAKATPRMAYLMAMGALEQLVTERVDASRTAELAKLSEPAMRVTIATLEVWAGPGLTARVASSPGRG